GDGGVEITFGVRGLPAMCVGPSVLWIERDRLFVVGDGAVVVPLVVVGQTATFVSVGAAGCGLGRVRDHQRAGGNPLLGIVVRAGVALPLRGCGGRGLRLKGRRDNEQRKHTPDDSGAGYREIAFHACPSGGAGSIPFGGTENVHCDVSRARKWLDGQSARINDSTSGAAGHSFLVRAAITGQLSPEPIRSPPSL